MKNSVKYASFKKYGILGLMALLFCSVMTPVSVRAEVGKPLTKKEIKDELYKQTKDTHIAKLTANGASLTCPVQNLNAEATGNKILFQSTNKDFNFSINLKSFGRKDGTLVQNPLTNSTKSLNGKNSVEFKGNNITEKITTKYDGITQDFVIHSKPAGKGDILVNLDFKSATLNKRKDGSIILTVDNTDESFTYNKLVVKDANGKKLNAKFVMNNSNSISIVADDTNATYPITIDPTITDVDWERADYGIFGDSTMVFAVAYGDAYFPDGFGKGVYIGGRFSQCGDAKNTRYIAVWDIANKKWNSVGKGLDGPVYALAVTRDGSNTLYAGGAFVYGGNFTSGDTKLNYIARYGDDPEHKDPTGDYGTMKWRPLAEGMNKPVYALALSDIGGDTADLYVGGAFTTPFVYFAKWFYTIGETTTGAFDGLGAQFDAPVYAVGVDINENKVWVGGSFSRANVDENANPTVGTSYLALYKPFVTKDEDGNVGEPEYRWTSGGFIDAGNLFAPAVYSIAIKDKKVFIGGKFVGIGHVPPEDPDATDDGTDGEGIICATEDDGANWIGCGSGTDSEYITSLALSKDGKAYATDNRGDVVVWDGDNGTGLTDISIPGVGAGSETDVFSLAVNGNEVYAGGDFSYIGYGWKDVTPELPIYQAPDGLDRVKAKNIAVYDGDQWFALQQIDPNSLAPIGIAGAGPAESGHVNAIAVSCKGVVYYGGSFTQMILRGDEDQFVEIPANNVVYWTPSDGFMPLDFSYNKDNLAMKGLEFKFGQKSMLNGVNGEVGALAVTKATTAPPKSTDTENYLLYIGGAFTEAVGIEAKHIVRARTLIENSLLIRWQNIGECVTKIESEGGYKNAGDIPMVITAMTTDQDHNLYVGGHFEKPGKNLAKWVADGEGGGEIGGGIGADSDSYPSVYALTVDEDKNLYVGGNFTEPAEYLVKFDAEKGGFVDLGGSFDKPVLALNVDSNGKLYVGGDFTTSASDSAYAAIYQGAWLPISKKINGPVYDIAIDSGDIAYFAGDFSFVGDDDQICNNIAKWDTIDEGWKSLGHGVGVIDSNISNTRAKNQDIYAVVYNDKFCELEVGGAFTHYKSGGESNRMPSMARCDLRYLLTYNVCTPAINQYHDHNHGYLSPGTWMPNKNYVVGDYIITSDGKTVYKCTKDGLSAPNEPEWGYLDETSDNSTSWAYDGKCVSDYAQDMDIWQPYNPNNIVNKKYQIGDYVTDEDKQFVYQCTAVNGAGLQGSTPPEFIKKAGTVTDRDLEWTYVGYADIELQAGGNKTLIQYVRKGHSALPVTAIPDRIEDTGGDEYFLAYWTARRKTTKCNDNPCIPERDETSPYDPYNPFDKFNPLTRSSAGSIVNVAHFARMIYVDENAVGANNGKNWDDAYIDLQNALDEAKSFDMVLVAKGTYYPSTDGDRNATFALKKHSRLMGGFDGTETFDWNILKRNSRLFNEYIYQRDFEKNETILSGDVTPEKAASGYTDDPSDNAFHVITGPGFVFDETLESAEDITEAEKMDDSIPVVVDGVTILGGYADGDEFFSRGGGVLVKTMPFFFRHCLLKNNFAKEGGAVYVQEPYFTPMPGTKCKTACWWAVKTWIDFYTPERKKIIPTIFEHTVFVNNEAITGGAVAAKKTNIYFEFCTVAKNKATIGGAVSLDGVLGKIISVDNQLERLSPNSNIINSIFYENRSTDASTYDNVVVQNGAQMRYDYSDVVEPKKEEGFIYPGVNNMSKDPQFVSLGSNENWEENTEYLIGDVINTGQLKENFVCISSGVSGTEEPDWTLAPNIANTIEDGPINPLTGGRLTWQKQAWDNTIDVHVKSTAGHYTVNGWVYDATTSPTIDMAAPVDVLHPHSVVNNVDYNQSTTDIKIFFAPIYQEPARNGGTSNLGAYGQTMYASKTWDVAGFTDAIVVTSPDAENHGSKGLRVGLPETHTYPITWYAQGPSMNSSVTVTIDLYKGGTLLGEIANNVPLGNKTANGGYIGQYDWDIEAFTPALEYGDDYAIKITTGDGVENSPMSDFTINRYYQLVFQTDGTQNAVIKDMGGQVVADENSSFTISVLSGQPTPALTAYLGMGGDVKFVNWSWDDPQNPGTTLYTTNNPIDAIVTGDMSITANFGGPLQLTLLNCSAADGSESPITIYESEKIQLIADAPPSGSSFNQNWTITPDTNGGSFNDPTKAIVIFTMAGANVTVQPEYAANAEHILTIIDGTSNGVTTVNVPEGGEVEILADDHSTLATPEHFNQWTIETGSSDAYFENVNESPTVFTMGSGDVTIKANYEPSKTISLTVIDGVVNPVQTTYYEQTTYELVANTPPAGSYFVGWTTENGGSFDDETAATTHYTTPGNDATVTAVFREMPTLTVENGILPSNGNSTSGQFIPKTVIDIQGQAPADKPYFAMWKSNGGGEFADQYSETTTFTMPANDATITAEYTASPKLIVINGQGSGEYATDSLVDITADQPEVGEYFVNWTDNSGSSFVNPNDVATQYRMPNKSAVVTANFATTPTLTIVNGDPEGTKPTIPGSVTVITAKSSNAQFFERWDAKVDDVQDITGLEDPGAMITNYTMPDKDAVVTALYSVDPLLTVVNGIDLSKSGVYHGVGQKVSIQAVPPVSGMHFKGWVTSDGGAFGDAASLTTTYTMPNHKATVKAMFVWNVTFEVANDPTNPTASQGSIIGLTTQEVENNGSTQEVTARGNPGYIFKSWDDGSTENPRIATNITEDTVFIAEFDEDPDVAGVITLGILLQIPADDFPNGAGKVFGSYAENGKPKVAPAKQIEAGDPYLAEWVRKISLYSKKDQKTAFKAGMPTDQWLLEHKINPADCLMSVKSGKNTTPLLRPNYIITPPHITAVNSWDGAPIDGVSVKGVHMSSLVLLEGEYFGSKPPKVYIEYKDYSDKLKRKKLKVFKIFPYADAKGKENKSCMDVKTGISKLYVQMPKKWWEDWGTKEKYLLVLDNGFGIDTAVIRTIPSGQNTPPKTGSKVVSASDAAGAKYIIIDVLNDTVDKSTEPPTVTDDGCSDAEADFLKITLPSKVSSNGSKLSVYKKMKIKYTPSGGEYPDTFSYTVDDGHGGVKNGTVTIEK